MFFGKVLCIGNCEIFFGFWVGFVDFVWFWNRICFVNFFVCCIWCVYYIVDNLIFFGDYGVYDSFLLNFDFY